MTKHREPHLPGLAADLRTLARRDVLRWIGAASLLPLVGCGDDGTTGLGPDAATTGSDGAQCARIPEETAGPYPGDGSNGKDALVQSGVVRSDIRASFAGATGVAMGVPLRIELKVVNVTSGCSALAGYAVYLWHCDKDGNYSMYSSAVASENYLRGVQETDADGIVTFETIFPGCYAGRMPHVHFEVFASLAQATASGNQVRTSQLGFPDGPCDEVYAQAAYSQSKTNYAGMSFATDSVFSDGTALQIASVNGDVASGYVATLQVGVAT